MNHFVIDMPNSRTGLRSGYSASGDSQPAERRVGPVRTAWPFLVNTSSRGDQQQPLQQESGSPSGFAS